MPADSMKPMNQMETASEISLKPCPFCGPGRSIVTLYQDEYGYWTVGCGACGSHSGKRPPSDTDGAANVAALWNSRPESAMPDDPLSVTVGSDARLIASIGIDTLAWAAEHMDANNPHDDALGDFVQLWKIKDNREFANDVRLALCAESEDGSTMLTEMLDHACLAAIENGSLACSEIARKAGKAGGRGRKKEAE